MLRVHRRLTAVAGAALVLLAGCERGPVGKAMHAEGVVKLDNKPLADVIVQFIPEGVKDGAPGSFGRTDAQGHFVLVTADGRDGAVIGKHSVMVRADRGDPGGSGGAEKKVPEVYAEATPANPLGVIEVTEGHPPYELNLKSSATNPAASAGRGPKTVEERPR